MVSHTPKSYELSPLDKSLVLTVILNNERNEVGKSPWMLKQFAGALVAAKSNLDF